MVCLGRCCSRSAGSPRGDRGSPSSGEMLRCERERLDPRVRVTRLRGVLRDAVCGVSYYSLRRFFVGPDMPDSAARWPYLGGPATAADKYEELPHDGPRVVDTSVLIRGFHRG